MSNLQSALNNKQEQLLQRVEKDKAIRVDSNKYAALENSLGKVALIPVIDIIIDDNCRKTFDTESVTFFQLASSIKKEGILQNLIIEVRKEPEFKLVCIAGQRRLLIAKMLGIEKVPCLITAQTKTSDSLSRSLDENILREGLIALDLAESYLVLLKDGWDIEKIAERYEKNSRTIRYYINLAKFPEQAKNIIRANQNIFTTRVLFNDFAKKTWSSENDLINALINKTSDKSNNKVKEKNTLIPELEKSLLNKIGLKVKLQKNKNNNGGKITFSFKNDEELNKLLEQFS